MIAWEEEGSGPPIVLVHGLTEDRRGWDPVVELLRDDFRCVRLDLRGHGESDDSDDYAAPSMAADVGTVVAEAGITEPPLLIGHSLGAMVVTAYAAGAPVGAVVNVDQSLELAPFATALGGLASQLRGTEAEFRAALEMAFAGLGTAAIPEPWRTWAEGKHAAARQEVVTGVWSMVLDSDPAELQAFVDPMLRAVAAPYLAIHGGDPGPGYAGWLRERIASAAVEVWDGDGHYPHLVEPERFARRVRELAG